MEAEEEELSKLVSDFSVWQETTSTLQKENADLQKELKSTQKKVHNLGESFEASNAEVKQLRAIVDKLHDILSKRYDFEGENLRLKKELANMQKKASQLEDTHCCQMAEAMENLQALSSKHKAEMAAAQRLALQQLQQACQAKDKETQEKIDEIKLLQREKSELERAKHTDIVKLRLECDAKMLKLQKQQQQQQSEQVQNSHSASSSNEIFRKKLQHLKAESEKEKAFLRSRVEELESLLENLQRTVERRL